LRDELAGEGVAKDGLAQGRGAFQLRFEVGFKVVNDGKLIFDGFDDGQTFGRQRVCMRLPGVRKDEATVDFAGQPPANFISSAV
jgi:hypothetical protein